MQQDTVLFARQAILDVNKHICAYQLLLANNDGSEQQISQILSRLFFDLDIDVITEGHSIYLDVPLHKISLPPSPPNCHIVLFFAFDNEKLIKEYDCLKALKDEGYDLGLYDPEINQIDPTILSLFTHIKLSFSKLGIKQVIDKSLQYKESSVMRQPKVIATDLTLSQQMTKLSKESQISQFSGDYLHFKEDIKGHQVPIYKSLITQLITQLHSPFVSLGQLSATIETDSTLSYKIIKLTKSAMYYRNFSISNVQRALEVIGLRDLLKWFGMALITSIDGKPDCLYKMAISRAYFCQTLCERLYPKLDGAFITGLFSYLPAFFNDEMENLIEPLPLDIKIKEALLEQSGNLGGILKVITLYEAGQWNKLPIDSLKRSGIDAEMLKSMYLESLKKTHELDY